MSSESVAYVFTVIAGGLGLGLLVGFPLAWMAGLGVEGVLGPRAQAARVAAGLALVVAGAALWYAAAWTFLTDALVLGLGAGFLLDAARRARPTAHRGKRAKA